MRAAAATAIMFLVGCGDAAPPQSISREDAAADVATLVHAVESRYAYADRAGYDWRAAADALTSSLPERIDVSEFALRLNAFVARFGDGHSGVRSPERSEGFAPLAAFDVGGRFVAAHPDLTEFIIADHPFVRTIDGAAVDDWLAPTRPLIADGSDAFVRAAQARRLADVGTARRMSGAPMGTQVVLECENEDRSSVASVRLDLGERQRGPAPQWRDPHRDGIAYVRIEQMDDSRAFLDGLRAELNAAASARAVILDLRGNGGGTRDALLEVLPRLMKSDEPPAIVNVARLRRDAADSPENPEGYLEDRFLYPATSGQWTHQEQEMIQDFLSRFTPDWTPADERFSAWHVMVVRPDLPAGVRRIASPVAVLMDGGCFSATDIMLGALKGRPGVVLVGAPSGGGSGRARSITLRHSKLECRLSSMASFRPDGSAYDGRGVAPDVPCDPDPEDVLGRGDAVMQRALMELDRLAGARPAPDAP